MHMPRAVFAAFLASRTVAANCPSTCFGDTCDAWLGKGTTCADLEDGYSCDCEGCECDDASDDGKGAGDDGKGTDDKDWDWDDEGKGVAPSPTAALSGSWSVECLESGGLSRTYWVYAPDVAAYSGIMIFFHGAGGGAYYRHDYRVAENADAYGFVGVVPVGSDAGGDDDDKGGGDDGKRRRRLDACDDGEFGFGWNVASDAKGGGDGSGVDEVAFVHAVVAEVAAAYDVAADAPVVALGFSNGAALSALVGCHDSSDLWVAHVGVRYDPEADYPSTCESKQSPCAEWNAVGDEDWFLDGLGPTPTEGVLAQFEASRDAAGCPDEATTVTDGGECHAYASCPSLGMLCVPAGVGHEITDTTTASAWTYLTGDGSCDATTAATCDSASWRRKADPDRGCDWVAKKRKRCKKKSEDGVKAKKVCLQACNKCPDDDCGDSTSWFTKRNGKKKYCDWVAKKPDARCGEYASKDNVEASEGCFATCQCAAL